MIRHIENMVPILALLSSFACSSQAFAEDKGDKEVSIEASLLAVGQRALTGTQNGKDEHEINFRGDIGFSVPAGKFNDSEGELFLHVRMGQGHGLNMLNPTLAGTANSTTFAQEDGDFTARIVQAWYELSVPLGITQEDAQSQLKITAGKIDPFVFFDQNDVADDESAAFLNNVFVHNPLLDSGGDIEADEFGFAPGMRIAYRSEKQENTYWQVSLGVFGKKKWNKPFVIGQVETGGKYLLDKEGTYRLYAWSGKYATPYANEFDSSTERHTGWGVSANQQLAEHVSLFARYGHSTKGNVQFNRAVTAGVEVGGAYWGRESDRVGIAAGWLNSSKGFRAVAPVLDVDGDTNADFGFLPTGSEKQYEIYYAVQINEHFELSPDFQWIKAPGGDASAKNISIVGVRAKFGF